MKRTVVALFRSYAQAERAVQHLLDDGVDRNDISIMAADPARRGGVTTHTGDARMRAASGAVVGGIAGAVLGLTAIVIPGIGPFLAAGPIVSALSGVAGGVVGGGIIGAFIGLGLDHDTAKYYARGVEEGGAVVAVRAHSRRAASIESKLHETEATHVGNRGRTQDADAQPRETPPMYGASSAMPPGAADHQYATGDAQQEEDAVDTRVKNDTGPEHFAPRNSTYSSSFDEFAGVLARDETVILGDRQSEYEPYRAAYDFGHRMAEDDRFAGRDWSNAEREIRDDWEKRNSTQAWDRIHAFVQRGWEAARGAG